MVTVSDQICCEVTKSDRIKIGHYLRSWVFFMYHFVSFLLLCLKLRIFTL